MRDPLTHQRPPSLRCAPHPPTTQAGPPARARQRLFARSTSVRRTNASAYNSRGLATCVSRSNPRLHLLMCILHAAKSQRAAPNCCAASLRAAPTHLPPPAEWATTAQATHPPRGGGGTHSLRMGSQGVRKRAINRSFLFRLFTNVGLHASALSLNSVKIVELATPK